jgi:hypothetical protein
LECDKIIFKKEDNYQEEQAEVFELNKANKKENKMTKSIIGSSVTLMIHKSQISHFHVNFLFI